MPQELRPGQGKHVGVRHDRMLREVGAFGFDAPSAAEALELVAAFAPGAAATLCRFRPLRFCSDADSRRLLPAFPKYHPTRP
ncbi:MAG: hypothetical protein JNM79_20355 [Burkholderiales bacterium]|nr:hypothetical protein [Burkholderiales bacterium]